MLVLSRKVGERIQLGDHITVTLVKIQGNTVRLGIEAPPNMTVVREELRQRATEDAIAVSVVPEAAGTN
jgi:carbon storage regulator